MWSFLGLRIAWIIPPFYLLRYSPYTNLFQTLRAILRSHQWQWKNSYFYKDLKNRRVSMVALNISTEWVRLSAVPVFTRIQFSHLRAMFSMSLSNFGHQKYESAIAFMLLISECTECSSRNNVALNCRELWPYNPRWDSLVVLLSRACARSTV